MILPIYTYGQPVLRKVAQDIPTDYPELDKLIADMFETLDAASGVGLAAPQIGKAIRVVVIDLDVLKEDYPQYAGFRHAFINGHIIERPTRRPATCHGRGLPLHTWTRRGRVAPETHSRHMARREPSAARRVGRRLSGKGDAA